MAVSPGGVAVQLCKARPLPKWTPLSSTRFQQAPSEDHIVAVGSVTSGTEKAGGADADAIPWSDLPFPFIFEYGRKL